MKSLSDKQFTDYRFQTFTYDKGKHSAAVMISPDGEAVGSMSVRDRRDLNESSQRRINNTWNRQNNPRVIAYSGLSEEHHQRSAAPHEEQIPGQLRWEGGTFESNLPHVAWMGIHSEHRHPALVRGLSAALVGERGHMPMADEMLSEDGSRISRGMSRRFGLKPHPNNPTMEANLMWDEVPSEDIDHMVLDYAQQYSRAAQESSDIDDLPVRTWTPKEADSVASELEEKHSTRSKKPPVLNENQMNLF